MRTIKLLSALFLIIPCLPHAQAGQEAHGGGALICLSEGRTTIELLDFKEAAENGIKIPPSDELIEMQIHLALNKLAQYDPLLAKQAAATWTELRTQVEFTNPRIGLVPPPDTGLKSLPSNCFLAGLAQYRDDEKRLTISSALYHQLNRQTQAGLWLHEIIYKTLRDQEKAQNSITSRKLTAFLMSNEEIPGDFKPVTDQDYRTTHVQAVDYFTGDRVNHDQRSCSEISKRVENRLIQMTHEHPVLEKAYTFGLVRLSAHLGLEPVVIFPHYYQSGDELCRMFFSSSLSYVSFFADRFESPLNGPDIDFSTPSLLGVFFGKGSGYRVRLIVR